MKLSALALVAILALTGCAMLQSPADQIKAAQVAQATHGVPAAPTGSASSGSVCADLVVAAHAGASTPGVLDCLEPGLRGIVVKGGDKTDALFDSDRAAMSKETGWHYIGRDVAGDPVYDLFNKQHQRTTMVVLVDSTGHVDDWAYARYER